MSRASKHQRDYFWSKVVKNQHGTYCKGCLSIKNLILDKINNDGDHSISRNKSKDFQILCKSCNGIKNPRGKSIPKTPDELDMTSSERKNYSAEKPLMDWLLKKLRNNETIAWKYFIAEGSFLFDISPKTIETRYHTKYFMAPSGPFTTYTGHLDVTYVKLKDHMESEND